MTEHPVRVLRMAKERVYLDAGRPWGETYLYATVWYCGDEICDCSQAQIQKIGPNLNAGRPWVRRDRVWEGTFYTEGEQGAEAELRQRLAELEATGEYEIVTDLKGKSTP